MNYSITMIRSKKTGRYTRQPKKVSFKDLLATGIFTLSVVMGTGYAIGHQLPVQASSETVKIISPLPANFQIVTPSVTPTLTATPQPVQNVIAKTTTTPVLVVEVVSEPADKEAVKAYIATKDWPLTDALRIAGCESNYRSNAVGDVGLPDGGPVSVGVFQIRAFHNRPSIEELKDYVTNIDWAHGMWKAQGFQPWTCK